MLLIDHNMSLIMDICDRIHVLDQGTTLAEGTPAEIRDNLDVAAAYLGDSPVPEDDAMSGVTLAVEGLTSATARSRPCMASRSRSGRARSSG